MLCGYDMLLLLWKGLELMILMGKVVRRSKEIHSFVLECSVVQGANTGPPQGGKCPIPPAPMLF